MDTDLLPKSIDAFVQPCSLQDSPLLHPEVDWWVLTSGGSYFLQVDEVVTTDLMDALDLDVASQADPREASAPASTLDQAPDSPVVGAARQPACPLSPSGAVQVPAGPALTWCLWLGTSPNFDTDPAGFSTPTPPSLRATVLVVGYAVPAATSSALALDPGAPPTSSAPSPTHSTPGVMPAFSLRWISRKLSTQLVGLSY
jgi:hypothetical protein